MFKKFHPIAFVVGLSLAIFLTIGSAELLLLIDKSIRRNMATWFSIIFELSFIFSFIIAGYITAFIAKKNPLLNALLLGSFFLLLKLWGIFSPYRSDPIINIIINGIICFTSCIIGGLIRKKIMALKNK